MAHSIAQRLLFATALASIAFSTPASAQDASSSPAEIKKLMAALEKQAKRLNAQEEKIAIHERTLIDQKNALAAEKAQFNQLKAQAEAITGQKIQTPVAASAQGNATNSSTQTASSRSTVTGATPDEVGTDRKQTQEKPPEIAAVIEEGGVLLQKGKMVVTPSVEYTRSSATRVAIDGFSIIPALNIGLFDISKVNRDTLTGAVGVRYGVTNRFEVEGKVPYVYRNDSTLSRPIGTPNAPEALSTVTGNDIGDVELGAHYQLNKGEDGWPFMIGNLRFKSATGTSPFEVPIAGGIQQELPTGSGFYALQPSVTAIIPTDPVVFYGNLGYLYNFERSFAGYGKVDAGDSISASLGMSLSLNDKTSFSMGYSHNTVFKTKLNGQSLPNSSWLQVGTLDLGYSYNLSPSTNLNFTVSAGLTDDAPDARLIFRVPIAFDMN